MRRYFYVVFVVDSTNKPHYVSRELWANSQLADLELVTSPTQAKRYTNPADTEHAMVTAMRLGYFAIPAPMYADE